MENTDNASPDDNQSATSNRGSSPDTKQTCNDTARDSGQIDISVETIDSPTGPPDGSASSTYSPHPGSCNDTTEESGQVEIPLEPLDSPTGPPDGSASPTYSPYPGSCNDTTEESGQVEISLEPLDSPTGPADGNDPPPYSPHPNNEEIDSQEVVDPDDMDQATRAQDMMDDLMQRVGAKAERKRERKKRWKKCLIITATVILFPLWCPFLPIILSYKICCSNDDEFNSYTVE